MARQHPVFQNRKSIVGVALVGLGLFILLRNVAEATSMVRFIRIAQEEADALGMLTAATSVIQKALQAYFFNHTEFLRALIQLLQSFSALVFIIVGSISFTGGFTARAKESKKKNEDMSISQPLVRRVVGSRDFGQSRQQGSFVANVGQ
jgi:hypothetical protein